MSVAITASEFLRQNKNYNHMTKSDYKKKIVDNWFSFLQTQICKEFESIEKELTK